jgi:hypothetical protein
MKNVDQLSRREAEIELGKTMKFVLDTIGDDDSSERTKAIDRVKLLTEYLINNMPERHAR